MKFRKIFRILHRDLGYFFIGLTCIYSISGIILIYKKDGKDPAFREVKAEKIIQVDLTPDELKKLWSEVMADMPRLNRVIPVKDQYRLFIAGGLGQYTPADGHLSCTVYEKKTFVKFINDIHYNSGKRYTWLGNIAAGSLIFLAISGAIIIKGRKGFGKRGVWLMLGGILLPLIWYLIIVI
ncbi:MAG: PepSY-associated TM helix domain-containing protein [Cytophagales bacterium]|nr:PepSY-associated TM helix domain-containing protein [Cytophagales bacterium]